MTEDTIEHITGVIAAKGSDAWYQMPVEELLPERLRHQADQLDKGQDTMDVWSVVLGTPPCAVLWIMLLITQHLYVWSVELGNPPPPPCCGSCC